MARCAAWRSFAEREEILYPGTPTAQVYAVVEGRTRVYGIAASTRELSLLYFGPGSVIDLVQMPQELQDVVYVEALEPALLLRVPGDTFHDAVAASPGAAAQLNRDAGGHAAELALLAWELAVYDTPTRLRHLLARLASEDPAGRVWSTHEDLAARIGASREEVTRVLHELDACGLIARESHVHGIEVRDARRLAEGG